MTLAEKNNILYRLGRILHHLSKNDKWTGYDLGINADEYDSLNDLIMTAHIYNGWFKEAEVRRSIGAISNWLTPENLENWESRYKIKDQTKKSVAIIMAGNIPLVGFHDLISVFLSGHKAIVKMSSDDKHLLPAIVKVMALFNESIQEYVELKDGKIEQFDAVIATGSDNSSKYFERYFGRYPHIIRKNRTSIAVLTGNESKDELFELGHDIFDYYGLGCRNVSQIWIREKYDLNLFFEAIFDYNPIIHHNKYANNYDYNKAVYLMNEEVILDNGFLLLKEEASLHSPLAVLHYQRYQDIGEVNQFIARHKEQIQVVLGHGGVAFGNSQSPGLCDYADGVDTMAFLTAL